jgi:hypothetical protein
VAFGMGWTLDKLTIGMIEPRYLPLLGYADAWSRSTAGEVAGAPVLVAGKSPEEIAALGPQLKGAIVLSQPMMTNFVRKDRPQPSDPDYVPMSAAYATSAGRGRGAAAARETPQQRAQRVASAQDGRGRRHQTERRRARDGVRHRRDGNGVVPSVTLSGEHYNMVARNFEAGIPVKLRVNVQTTFNDDNGNAYNVLASCRTDPVLKDEVVMIGVPRFVAHRRRRYRQRRRRRRSWRRCGS